MESGQTQSHSLQGGLVWVVWRATAARLEQWERLCFVLLYFALLQLRFAVRPLKSVLPATALWTDSVVNGFHAYAGACV